MNKERNCWNCRMRAFVHWRKDEGYFCFEKLNWIAKFPGDNDHEKEMAAAKIGCNLHRSEDDY